MGQFIFCDTNRTETQSLYTVQTVETWKFKYTFTYIHETERHCQVKVGHNGALKTSEGLYISQHGSR